MGDEGGGIMDESGRENKAGLLGRAVVVVWPRGDDPIERWFMLVISLGDGDGCDVG